MLGPNKNKLPEGMVWFRYGIEKIPENRSVLASSSTKEI